MKISDARLTPDERDTLERVARELNATVVDAIADPDELVAERYGIPALVTEVRCRPCGGLLIKDVKDRWVHVHGTSCSRAEPMLTEASA